VHPHGLLVISYLFSSLRLSPESRFSRERGAAKGGVVEATIPCTGLFICTRPTQVLSFSRGNPQKYGISPYFDFIFNTATD
jgi:hypothetical protein